MSEVEKLHRHAELGEHPRHQEPDNHHERGQLGASIAIAKKNFHDLPPQNRAAVVCSLASVHTEFCERCEGLGIGIPDGMLAAGIKAK